MKALLAAAALFASLAIAVPLSMAQTAAPPSQTTTSTTVTPATPTAPATTTTSASSTSTTGLAAGGSQTTTTTTSTTTTPGSCHTHHSDGQACSCLKAPMSMGTAQNHRCAVSG